MNTEAETTFPEDQPTNEEPAQKQQFPNSGFIATSIDGSGNIVSGLLGGAKTREEAEELGSSIEAVLFATQGWLPGPVIYYDGTKGMQHFTAKLMGFDVAIITGPEFDEMYEACGITDKATAPRYFYDKETKTCAPKEESNG